MSPPQMSFFPASCLAVDAAWSAQPTPLPKSGDENDDEPIKGRPAVDNDYETPPPSGHVGDGAEVPPGTNFPPPNTPAGPKRKIIRRRRSRQIDTSGSSNRSRSITRLLSSQMELPQVTPIGSEVDSADCHGDLEAITDPWIEGDNDNLKEQYGHISYASSYDRWGLAGDNLFPILHRGVLFLALSVVAGMHNTGRGGSVGGDSGGGGGNILTDNTRIPLGGWRQLFITLPQDVLPSLFSAMLLAWVPTLVVQRAWWDLAFLVTSLTVQPSLRLYVQQHVLPICGHTIQKMFWGEVWKHVWDFLLQPFPQNLLVPSRDGYIGSISHDSHGRHTDGNRRQSQQQQTSSKSLDGRDVSSSTSSSQQQHAQGLVASWLSTLSSWNRYWHHRLLSRADKWTSSLLRKSVEKRVQSSISNLVTSSWEGTSSLSSEMYIFWQGKTKDHNDDDSTTSKVTISGNSNNDEEAEQSTTTS